MSLRKASSNFDEYFWFKKLVLESILFLWGLNETALERKPTVLREEAHVSDRTGISPTGEVQNKLLKNADEEERISL